MKRIFPVALGLTALLAVTGLLAGGCAAGGRKSVLDADRIVIGVRPDLPSVGFRRPDGTFEGFDVDVARYIARKLGKGVTFEPVLAAEREKAITSGKADLVLATYTISMDRKQKVLFAGPYHISYQDILVRRDEGGIRNVRDLKGRRICEVQGSNAAQRVVTERKVAAQVVPFPDYAGCLAALKQDRVDAITTNDVILAGLAIRDGSGLRLANAQFNEQRTGVGMRKGDVEGCEEVNRAITEMYQDGTASRLLHHWFGKAGLNLSTIAVPQFEGCS
ncbi:glutamate ABC transporter substrate-binding protein [Nonomuraea roseoviolacea subsp. roseoviolacea]|uniref:Glutamate transport system substrate-binding protein n=1 Tax=Nonomuraea roseoviolacea subsp. carminata TaxID=160689 RepID=A0ABT1JSP0_9ACTN|nr:glutamate ABC transporter substrate-binding protein [Nonomuraea roseoviolacea]MCP2344763.1 glutamate transport system substrate-binding protein [Nonomuraea roseoviolacea subsp. carminata]